MPPAKLSGPCILEGQGPCRTGSRAFRRLTDFAFHKIHPAVRDRHPGLAVDAVLCHGHYMRLVEAGRGGNSRPYWERETTRVFEEQIRAFGGKVDVRSAPRSLSYCAVPQPRCNAHPCQQLPHDDIASFTKKSYHKGEGNLTKRHLSPASPECPVPFGMDADDIEMNQISVSYNTNKPSYSPSQHAKQSIFPTSELLHNHFRTGFVRRPRGRPRTAINKFIQRGFDPQLFEHKSKIGAAMKKPPGFKQGASALTLLRTDEHGCTGLRAKQPYDSPQNTGYRHATVEPSFPVTATAMNQAHQHFSADIEDNLNPALLLMFLASRARRTEPRIASV